MGHALSFAWATRCLCSAHAIMPPDNGLLVFCLRPFLIYIQRERERKIEKREKMILHIYIYI